MKYMVVRFTLETYKIFAIAAIDEYSMMTHRQGNTKLEYNGVFRAQLCMITGSRSVK